VVEAEVSWRGVRPRLVAVWALLLGLVATILFIERSDILGTSGADPHGHAEPQSGDRMLVPAPMDQIAVIEIAQGGTLYRFERDAAGSWFYHAHGLDLKGALGEHGHQADPVQAQRIEKAFAAFGRTRMERDLAVDPGSDPYGVTRPQMLILVYRTDDPRPLGQYAVGDVAPDTYSRYVLPLGSPVVVTIANYQIDNLRGLIDAVAAPSEQPQAAKSAP
jgi:hypothetical protein